MEQPKKWYKSKIFMLSVTTALIGATDLAFGWLSGSGVTTEQIQVIHTTLPGTASAIKDAIDAKNIFSAFTAGVGFLTAIWRAWFTAGAPISFK